jgi:hypothetical protein
VRRIDSYISLSLCFATHPSRIEQYEDNCPISTMSSSQAWQNGTGRDNWTGRMSNQEPNQYGRRRIGSLTADVVLPNTSFFWRGVRQKQQASWRLHRKSLSACTLFPRMAAACQRLGVTPFRSHSGYSREADAGIPQLLNLHFAPFACHYVYSQHVASSIMAQHALGMGQQYICSDACPSKAAGTNDSRSSLRS